MLTYLLKPGLGLEMDEDRIKEISQEGLVWTNPQWKNYDGRHHRRVVK